MKKLVLLLAVIIPFGFIANAQIQDDDPQMFGSKRNVPQSNFCDFESITEVVKHEFVIKNLGPGEIIVVDFEAPEGFDVIITDKNIQSRTTGTFTVVVNPDLIPKGSFEEKITIITEQNNSLGKTTKDHIYTVKGIIQ